MAKAPKKRNKKYRAPDPRLVRTSTAMMRLSEADRQELKDTPFRMLVRLVQRCCTPYCVKTIRFRVEYIKVVASLVNETEEILDRAQKAIYALEDVIQRYAQTQTFSIDMDQVRKILDALNVADALDDVLLRREMLIAYNEVSNRMRRDPVFKVYP